MASGVEPRRTTSSPELDLSSLNNVERLVFAQAIHEFGANAWQEVAGLLSKHPMMSQPKGAITPQSCSALYRHLMEDAGFEWSEADVAPRSEKHLRLAQRYYVARVAELRELIALEEVKFKKLVVEVDEIRSGTWDDKILVSLGVEPEKPMEQETQETAPEPRVTEPPSVQEPEEETTAQEEGEAIQEVAMEEEEESPPADQTTETAVELPAVELPSVPEIEEREERSDNEAVNQLIGNFSSYKPVGETPDAVEPRREETLVAQPHEDAEMQVDEASVKQEQEEDEPSDEQLAERTIEAEGPVEGEGGTEGEGEGKGEAEVEVEAEAEAETTTDAGAEGLPEPIPEPAPEPTPEPAPEPIPSARAEGKRKASDADTMLLDAQREKKRPREESEPAEEEEGGAPKTRRRERTGVSDKRFQNMIGMLHSQISAHRYGNIFHNPIKKSEAPDYHDIVKRPMDLKTIKSRVKDGLISNSLEFQRDIFLMFANAMMYNRPGSEIYNMAEEMMLSSEHEITAFRQTEGFHRM